jgi:hypothetical protein
MVLSDGHTRCEAVVTGKDRCPKTPQFGRLQAREAVSMLTATKIKKTPKDLK